MQVHRLRCSMPSRLLHEGPNFLVINPEECIDCHLCVDECPVNAIYPEDEVPDDQQEFIEINAALASQWPVIDQVIPAPKDANKWAQVKSKTSFEKSKIVVYLRTYLPSSISKGLLVKFNAITTAYAVLLSIFTSPIITATNQAHRARDDPLYLCNTPHNKKKTQKAQNITKGNTQILNSPQKEEQRTKDDKDDSMEKLLRELLLGNDVFDKPQFYSKIPV